MPNEKGGLAAKAGDVYERKVVIYYIIKLLNEKIDNLTIEALGDDEIATDIVVEHNGIKELIQCKSRNGNQSYWDFGSVNKRQLFTKWKMHLDRSQQNHVALISPLNFQDLEDLIRRAKNTNGSVNDFIEHQIKGSSKEFVELFNKICSAFALEANNEDDISIMINYLTRIQIRQFADSGMRENIIDNIDLHFAEKNETVYATFKDWIEEGDILHKKISNVDLYKIIDDKKMKLRNLAYDYTIAPRINELNIEYTNTFKPINKNVFIRDESKHCIKYIEEGQSLLIHGKAGIGKSGCIENIIQYCKDNTIPYLGLKLDKRVPSGSAYQYGKSLDLPTSIVHCIDSLNKNKKAVIILDQLDAIRWTQANSNTAIMVCEELIRQVKSLNNDRKCKISLVFVCRTYDVRHDNNIKSLFNTDDETASCWKEIEIGELSDEFAENLIGKEYKLFGKRLKELLRIPFNISVWEKLDDKHKKYNIVSTSNLVDNWWEQLTENYSDNNIANIHNFKSFLIDLFDSMGRLYVPKSRLSEYTHAISYLCSNNLLYVEEKKISFVHQTILDCFLSKKMEEQYYNGESITTIIGDVATQTPPKRYRLEMFMRNLLETSKDDFVRVGEKMLISDEIRFYNKYVFLEVLSQEKQVNATIKNFLVKYCEDVIWQSHLLSNVILKNIEFYKVLRDEGIIERWLNDNEKEKDAIWLIRSIAPDFDTDDITMLKNYALISKEKATNYLSCILYNMHEEKDEIFDLRMQVYRKYPDIIYMHFDIMKLLHKDVVRATVFLTLLIKEEVKSRRKIKFDYEEFKFYDNIQILFSDPLKIINMIVPLLPKVNYDIYFNQWRTNYNDDSKERTCIKILKLSNRALILSNENEFIKYYEIYMGKGMKIFDEIILDALFYLSDEKSDFAIDYLGSNLEVNMFDKTSGKNELYFSKRIIEKHFKMCTDETKQLFMKRLIRFYSSKRVDNYKSFHNRINKYKDLNKYKSLLWGTLQYEVLNIIEDKFLSKNALNLKKELNRKFPKGTEFYENNYSDGLHTIKYPLDKSTLTVENWRGIITNKKFLKLDERRRDTEDISIDKSLGGYAQSFNNAVAENPSEFIKMVLETKNIIPKFIYTLYDGVAHSNKLNDVPHDLLEKMLNNVIVQKHKELSRTYLEIILKCKNTNWSESVTNHIVDLMGSPEEDFEQDLEGFDDYQTLEVKLANHIKPMAICTLGRIMYENKDLYCKYKNKIHKIIAEDSPVTKLASISLLYPIYNIDKQWACEKLIECYEYDYRFVLYRFDLNLLFSLKANYGERIKKIIVNCFNSNNERIVYIGAFSLADLYLFESEFEEMIENSHKLSNMQKKYIVERATTYFNDERHNEKIKRLILDFKAEDDDLDFALSSLFNKKLIDANRDIEFLKILMLTNIGKRLLNSFLKWLENSPTRLFDFRKLIVEVCENVINNLKLDKNDSYFIERDLIKLIIGLYDEATNEHNNDEEVANKCLDLWDNMFEYQIGSTRDLSKALIEM